MADFGDCTMAISIQANEETWLPEIVMIIPTGNDCGISIPLTPDDAARFGSFLTQAAFGTHYLESELEERSLPEREEIMKLYALFREDTNIEIKHRPPPYLN